VIFRNFLVAVTIVGFVAPTAWAGKPAPSKQTTYSYQQQKFATDNAGKTQAGSNNRWHQLKQRFKDRFKRWQLKKQYSPSVTRKAGKSHVAPTRFLWHMRRSQKASSVHGRKRRTTRAHPRSRHRQRFHSRVYKRFRSFWQRRLKRLRKAWLHKRNQRQGQVGDSERPVARNSRVERRRIQRWRDKIRNMVTRIKARRLEGRRFRIFTGPRNPSGSKLQALWRSIRSFGKRQAPLPRPRHQDPLAHQYQPQF
jgi:hypothetical protein